MTEALQSAIARLREGTEVLRTGGTVTLSAAECNALLDRLGDGRPLVAELTIEGSPVPKGRPRRASHGGVFTPDRTTEAENTIRWELRSRRVQPVAGLLAIRFGFFTATERRLDMDNLEKLVMDACNGFAYQDDSQVREKHTYLNLAAARPRTEIRIEELP